MLQTIHDKLKGWLAGVVLGIIGLVFIFWGINWTMSAPNYAAKVNGVEISSNDVRQAYQQQLAQYERQANGQLSDAERTDLKHHVLEEYVNSEALVTRTDDLGYRVSDQQLLTEMSRIPQLQVDGKWDLAHALAMLKAQGRPIGQIRVVDDDGQDFRRGGEAFGDRGTCSRDDGGHRRAVTLEIGLPRAGARRAAAEVRSR